MPKYIKDLVLPPSSPLLWLAPKSFGLKPTERQLGFNSSRVLPTGPPLVCFLEVPEKNLGPPRRSSPLVYFGPLWAKDPVWIYTCMGISYM
jgi:hypothetical protein